MKYVIQKKVKRKINTFYNNVAKKYKHTYSEELMHKNLDTTYNSIYKIENGLLRREPSISRWKGMYMAHAGKWYFAYRIEGDTISVYDACHAQNMHEAQLREKIHCIITEVIHNYLRRNKII